MIVAKPIGFIPQKRLLSATAEAQFLMYGPLWLRHEISKGKSPSSLC